MTSARKTARLLSAAASTNATLVKDGRTALKGIQGYNAAGTARYLKLYNGTAEPTVGTDTPVKTIYLPATTAFALDFPHGYDFSLGLGFAITGAAADADTTACSAGDVLCLNVDYEG